MIHQLTPRRKSDTLPPVRKLISPEAERADSSHASRQRESHHRLVDQQQQQQRRQDWHHSIQPPKLQKGASDDTSSSSSSSDDGFDSGDDDDDNNSTSSQSAHHATTTTTTTLDRASLIASLRPNTNTEGLSDYELLRLHKIQRNEAKLASLGLCGITTKNATVHCRGSNNNNNNNNNGISSNDHESSAKKAANTRRKNAANAKKMVELYERSLPPHRATRPKSPNYITTAAATAANPNSRIEQWKTRYSELQSFIAKYGTYDMLTRNLENGKYKPLCDWWNRQRLQYTKYKIGTKSTLGDEQIRLLDNLDDGRWRARKGGGGGETSVRGGGTGGGTNTSRRLWKASTDSETEDEDEYTWERINRDKQNEEEEEDDLDDEEDEYEEEEDVDESSTEAEEVDIGTVDSYSVESSSSVAIDGSFTDGHSKTKNGMRASYSSRERAARKPKRKRNSSISRSRGNSIGGGGKDSLSSTPTKRRRRGSLAIVSSLEKIPPSATKIVDGGEFASNNHRIDRRVHLRSMERRYNDGRQYTSDEEEEIEVDDDDKESMTTIEHDDIDRDTYRVVGPDSRRYYHRNTIHRQNYRRYQEYTHHRHRHGDNCNRNRWHRPVSEIIIAPLERDQHRRRHHHHHHHNRSFHQKYQNHHYQQQMQLQQQKMKEREALLREYGQLYKRKCALQDQMTIEMQYFSRYMIGSSSSRLESSAMTISTPSTAPTVATSSASSSRIRSAYSTTSTKTAASVAVSTATAAAAATATASVIESYHRRW